MTAAMLAFTIGFVILKLMDKFIDPDTHSSGSATDDNHS